MARRTKLTPEVQAKIVRAIQVGATYEIAAGYAGVTDRTIYNWLTRGEQAKSGIYFQFLRAVKEAQGQGAVRWLDVVEAAAVGQWQAAAWKLERKYPESYGRTVQDTRTSGEITIRIQRDNVTTTDSTRRTGGSHRRPEPVERAQRGEALGQNGAGSRTGNGRHP